MGFSVLPAALEMDILMLVRVTRAPEGEAPPPMLRVELRNTAPRFEAARFECAVADLQGVELQHEGAARWANYWKVALRVSCLLRACRRGSEADLASIVASTACQGTAWHKWADMARVTAGRACTRTCPPRCSTPPRGPQSSRCSSTARFRPSRRSAAVRP